MAARVQTKTTQIDKLKQREATLRRTQSVVAAKARQQADVGSLLHAIDLQQLEIENKQHLDSIDERSRELLALKVKVASATKVLNAAKKTIAEKDAAFTAITAEIHSRQTLLDKVAKESEVAETERAAAQAQNARLQAQLAEYVVPSVMDYVANKATLKDLRGAVATWQRKVEVGEMDHTRFRQRWQTLVQEKSMAHSAKIAAAVATAAWQTPAPVSFRGHQHPQ